MQITNRHPNISFKNNWNSNNIHQNIIRNSVASNQTQNSNTKQVQPQTKNNKMRDWLIGGAIALVGIAGLLIAKGRATKKTQSLGTRITDDFTDKEYLENLAKGISKSLGKEISTENLKPVMGRKELLKILPTLKEQDYLATKANKAEYKLIADLHSHTTASDGWGYAKEILEDAAKYGDELHKRTGKKFIIAITDHDSVGSKVKAANGKEYMTGTKAALEEIAQNPDKYKNIRFVPGVELSFAHKINDKGGVGASEVLMHCIDPYSTKLNNLIDNVTKGRDDMINSTIEELNKRSSGVSFDRKEMWGHFINHEGNSNSKKELFAYSLHHRVKNYAQIKGRITQLAKQENRKDIPNLYQELMRGFKKPKTDKSLNSFDEYLKSINREVKEPTDLSEISKICEEVAFPKIKDGEIKTDSEFKLNDIVDITQDEHTVIGFAHPHFMVKQLDNPEKIVAEMIKDSKGLIRTTEKYHQGYSSREKETDIKKANDIMEKFNLTPLGGRDNHSKGLFDSLK